jgi:hypothetical protein
MDEEIKELEEDVQQYELLVIDAQKDLEENQKWLDAQKLQLAEAIIRLHNKKYGK